LSFETRPPQAQQLVMLKLNLLFFVGWIWLPTATCPWNEAWWCPNAKFLCSSGSAGSARPATWRATWGWSCSTDPAASPSHAATGQ